MQGEDSEDHQDLAFFRSSAFIVATLGCKFLLFVEEPRTFRKHSVCCSRRDGHGRQRVVVVTILFGSAMQGF